MKKENGLSREVVDQTVALVGVLIVLVQVLYMAHTRLQAAIVVLGLLLIVLGVWRQASRVLPDRRIYGKLRAEVDRFLEIVSELNTHAVTGDQTRLSEAWAELHASVDRMGGVAARTDDREDSPDRSAT